MGPPDSFATRTHFRGGHKGLGRAVTMEHQSDGRAPAGAMQDADVSGAISKISYKFEEMAANDRTSNRTTLFRTPRPAKMQKTYSQYNLQVLDHTNSDGKQNMHGIYGLLARHIDVPQSVWDELAPKATRRKRRSIFGLPLLHPYSRAAVGWRLAMLLFDISFTAFWVPLNVGFCYSAYGDLGKACTRSDLAGGVVYVINWLVGFQMGVVLSCGAKRAVLMDGPAVARVYMSYGKFVSDMLASVPFFVLVSAIWSPGHTSPLLGLLALLRLVRLLRLVNTVKVVYQDSLSGHYRVSWVSERVSVSAMYLIILAYQFAVVINLTASLMILLSGHYGHDSTWYASMKWVQFEEASPAVLWLHAAYWVTTVLATAGQGQAPRQLGEQIVSNFCSIYGMVFNGLVVGVVGRALIQASNQATALYYSRKEVGRVSYWAKIRHLPLKLMKELQIYFADTELSRRDFNFEQGVIDGLPSTLRKQVVKHIVRGLVDKVHIFSSADPELRDLISELFRPLEVPPGHDLCLQGALADRLWLVESGDVVALRHKEAELQPTTGNTALLGEGVLLRGLMEVAATRPWTLRTKTACRLWELRWEEVEPLLRVYPRLITITLQDIRERLIRNLEHLPKMDFHWSELASVLARVVKQPSWLDSAQENLEALVQARESDASMALLFSSWLEAGISTSLELGEGGRKRGLVTLSIMLARQSRDALGASSYLPFGGAGGFGGLAAPSPALSARYGGGGMGGSLTGLRSSGNSFQQRLLSGVLAGFGGLGGPGGPGIGGGGPSGPVPTIAETAAAAAFHHANSGGGDDADAAPPYKQPSSQLLSAEGSLGGAGGGGSAYASMPAVAAAAALHQMASGSAAAMPTGSDGGGSSGGGGERPRYAVTAAAAAAAAGPALPSPLVGLAPHLMTAANRAPAMPSRLSVATDATHLPVPEPFPGAAGGAVEMTSRTDSLTHIANTATAFRMVDAGGAPQQWRRRLQLASGAVAEDPSDGEDGAGGGSNGGVRYKVAAAVAEAREEVGHGAGSSAGAVGENGEEHALPYNEATLAADPAALAAQMNFGALLDSRIQNSLVGSRTGAATFRLPSYSAGHSVGNSADALPLLFPRAPASAFTATAAAPPPPPSPPLCSGPTICQTCGKCTCPTCRSRVLAAALALEQGTATIGPGRVPLPSAAAAAAAAAQQSFLGSNVAAVAAAAAAVARRPSQDLERAPSGVGMGAGMQGRPSPTPPWVRMGSGKHGSGGGGSGSGDGQHHHQNETWRRRRMSMMSG